MKQTKRFILITVIIAFAFSSEAQVRLLTVDPSTGTVGLKNFGNSEVDISSHRLCHLFTYPVISSLTIVSGDPSALAAGEIVVVTGVSLNATASDLGFYLPQGAFSDPEVMLDFTEWGSGGNGRESVAVSKGIWEAGTFISDPAPYEYFGNGQDQNGVEFWETLIDDISEYELGKQISAYPNPVVEKLNISSEETPIESYKIVNMLGEIVMERSLFMSEKNIIINLSSLKRGNYILYLNTTKGIATKKITLTK
jgi:hypothetical protein